MYEKLAFVVYMYTITTYKIIVPSYEAVFERS